MNPRAAGFGPPSVASGSAILASNSSLVGSDVVHSGTEVIDTALKILQGPPAPKKTTLGSRLFTPENVEKGGVALQ